MSVQSIYSRPVRIILIASVLMLVLVIGGLVGADWHWAILFLSAFVTLFICLKAPLTWLLSITIATSSLIVYRWDVGIGQVSIYRVLLVLCVFRLYVLYFTHQIRLKIDVILFLLVMLVTWDVLGALYGADLRRGLHMALQETEFVLMYFVVLNSVSSLRILAMQVKAFVGSAALAIGFGIWQWLNVFVWRRPFQWPLWQYVRIDEGAKWLGVTGAWSPGVERVGSVLADPPNFAILLGLALLIVIAFIYFQKRMTLVNVLFLFGTGLMLFASGGRIGLFNSLLGIVLLLILLIRHSRYFPFRISGSRIVLVFVFVLLAGTGSVLLSKYIWGYDLWSELYERISRDISLLGVYDDGSGSSLGRRLFLIQRGLKAWANSPLLGVGTGGLLSAYGILGVHNTWVLRLAENGIIGFAIVTSITLLVLEKVVVLYRMIRKPSLSTTLLAQTEARWATAFIYSAPVLLIQLFIAWMWWGYWWQPFYILSMALLVVASNIVYSIYQSNSL